MEDTGRSEGFYFQFEYVDQIHVLQYGPLHNSEV